MKVGSGPLGTDHLYAPNREEKTEFPAPPALPVAQPKVDS